MANETQTRPVAAADVDKALDFARKGGRLAIRTAWRTTIIDRKTVARFDRAGEWLLKPDQDGKGIRLRRGRGSVYLFAGQLELVID